VLAAWFVKLVAPAGRLDKEAAATDAIVGENVSFD